MVKNKNSGSGRALNLFVFLSNFSRAFLDFFTAVFLYKLGFSIQQILLYYVVINASGVMWVSLANWLGHKYSFKKMLALVPPLFCLTFALMQWTPINTTSVVILGVIYGAYYRFYWMSRHYFTINESRKGEAANRSKWFTILETVGGLIATYMGALIIDRFGIWAGIGLATLVFTLGCMPIWLSHEQPIKHKRDTARRIWRDIPKRSFAILMLADCVSVAGSLFPLFIFISISRSLEFIGTFQIFVGLAAVVAVYVFGRMMDKKRSDLLLFGAAGLALVYMLKLNVSMPLLFMGVALLEGLFERFYRTSVVRDYIALGQDFNPSKYTQFYLTGVAIFEGLFMLAAWWLHLDLTLILYICAFGIVISGLLRFNDRRRV